MVRTPDRGTSASSTTLFGATFICPGQHGFASGTRTPNPRIKEWTARAHRTLYLHERLRNLPGTHATHGGATGTRSTKRSTASLPDAASFVTKRSQTPQRPPSASDESARRPRHYVAQWRSDAVILIRR